MSILASAAIAGGAALASTATNAMVAGKMNKRGERHANKMWEKQGQRELEYFNLQNAYNDPSAQMQRLKDAGLNPNLVYGNGATTESAPISPKSAQPVNFRSPEIDLGGVVMNALQARQLESNIARTEAETRAIDARTAGTTFQNQLNERIGIDKMYERYTIANEKLDTESKKMMAEYDAWQAGAFQGKPTDDPSSPIAKAVKAGYNEAEVQLENAKKLGDIRAYETTIKKFEASLTEQGLPANSPWYAKILGDLIMKTLNLKNLGQIGQGAHNLLNND